MARHPTARRIHHERTSPDDTFVEGALRTTAWAQEHRRLLILAAATLFVVVAAVFLFRRNQQILRDRAAIEILQIRQTAQSGNPALTIRDTEGFLETFGGTPAATEARLLLGQAYLASNQPQQAIDAVAELANELDSPSGVSAALLTAAAHEAATRFDDAERILLRVADAAPHTFQKIAALENAARIRFERGNAAGSAELYDRILQLLPADSQDRPVYEMRRAEAHAAATSGS